MMKHFLFLLLAFIWAFVRVPDALANHHEIMNEPVQQSLQNSWTRQEPLPASRTGISDQRAASLVKERHSGSRILGVSLIDQQGPPVYKVRTLSPEGVVRSVFVDAHSGEIFE